MREDLYRDLYEKEHTHWWHIGKRGIEFALLRRFLPAGRRADRRALDLGCGTGTLILMLRQRYTGVLVIGLDPDAKVLQRASNKFKRAGMSVQLDLGFSDQLPYEQKSFDRVFSSFMFHHLDEQERERTSREVSRVLKPTGTFHLLDFVADPAKDGFWDRLIESHALMKTNTDERLLQLIGRAGFTNVTKVKEGSMLFGLMRTSYFRASV